MPESGNPDVKCPKCGAEAETGDSFCPGCGSDLQSEAALCSKCGSELRPDSSYCARCGMVVPTRGRPVEVLSKAFFLGSIVGGWILGYVLLVAGIFARDPGATFGLVLFSALPLLYSVVVCFVLWYKAWDSIQDGHVRTTPCRAVGFMFIPFFNLYWLFQAVWGFARDYNSHIVRHRVSAPDLSEGLFLAACILSVIGLFLGWIPLIGYVIVIADLVLIVLIINAILDGVNRLARTP